MKKLLLGFGLAATVLACSEKTAPTAVTSPETVAPAMTADAEAGKSIFEANCQRCHGLKKIDDFSQADWSRILPNMASKAKLDASQTALVDTYIQWELAN